MPFLTEKLSLTGLRRLVKQMRQAHHTVVGTELPQHAAQEILAQTLGHPHWHAAHQQAQTVTRAPPLKAGPVASTAELTDADWVKVGAFAIRHHGPLMYLLATPLAAVSRWAASGRLDRLSQACQDLEQGVDQLCGPLWKQAIQERVAAPGVQGPTLMEWRSRARDHMKRVVLEAAIRWDRPDVLEWANQTWTLDQHWVTDTFISAMKDRRTELMKKLVTWATPETLASLPRNQEEASLHAGLVHPDLNGMNPLSFMARHVHRVSPPSRLVHRDWPPEVPGNWEEPPARLPSPPILPEAHFVAQWAEDFRRPNPPLNLLHLNLRFLGALLRVETEDAAEPRYWPRGRKQTT